MWLPQTGGMGRWTVEHSAQHCVRTIPTLLKLYTTVSEQHATEKTGNLCLQQQSAGVWKVNGQRLQRGLTVSAGRRKEKERLASVVICEAEFGEEERRSASSLAASGSHHSFCLKLLCLFPRKTTIQSMLFPFQGKHSQGHTALRLQGLFGQIFMTHGLPRLKGRLGKQVSHLDCGQEKEEDGQGSNQSKSGISCSCGPPHSHLSVKGS